MKPSKNRELELIDKKISQFQKILAEVTYDKLQYEAYESAYYDTELLLTELFPKEEPNNFHNHVVLTPFIEGKIFYEGELQEYKDNINSCIAYLKACRNRIQNFWGTEPDPGEERKDRSQFLQRLYTLTDGNEAELQDMYDIGKTLGFSRDLTTKIVTGLHEKDLIEFRVGSAIGLTPLGIRRVKEDLSKPDVFTYSTPVEIQESLKHFKQDHPDPTKVAFIMMQFGKTIVHNEIVKAIKSVLSSYGIEGIKADDKQYHDDLFYNVMTYVYGCTFGIAVFERIEADKFNPNVSLEVGYMLALKKPVCLLKDRTLKTLHTDLIGKLYKVFDPRDPDKTIPHEISKWLSDKDIV